MCQSVCVSKCVCVKAPCVKAFVCKFLCVLLPHDMELLEIEGENAC